MSQLERGIGFCADPLVSPALKRPEDAVWWSAKADESAAGVDEVLFESLSQAANYLLGFDYPWR